MRAASMLLLVVLILAAPAVSQTLDEKLIVPGVRVGKWTLKMSLNDLEKMNGAASVTRVQFADFRSEAFFYTWPSLDFGVSGYAPRKVGWFVAGFQGFVPYKTDKGIGLQSTRSDVLKAYGKPTVETMPRQGQTNLIYDALGIDFQIYHDGTIREIRIFRPGSAKSIWKF